MKHRDGIIQLLGNLFSRTLFMLYYVRSIKIIIFYTKKQKASVGTRIFYSRQNIMISIIHCKQIFASYKTSRGGK